MEVITKKVESILLVDDDQVNNFLCSKVIKQVGICNSIESCLNGETAIEFLKKSLSIGEDKLPDLIFLDINMPVLNGWGFLDKYRVLMNGVKKEIKIVILTSSGHSEDIKKAKNYPEVNKYVIKPLISNNLAVVIDELFED